MLIRSITTTEPAKNFKTITRVMNFGKFKDTCFTVDTFYKDGKAFEKRYVVWADNWQRIINKFRDNVTGRWTK